MLSIPSYKNDDPNYRYKMPKLVAKVEGRGNGIKTNIVNMAEIARALKRPPDYPTKFCGTELGAQSKFDPTEGKAIVNGAHEQRDLQVLIDKFIEKFVLCGNCKLPEIDLIVRKSRVQYRCNACGNKGDSDNTHKLAAFILKNPPDGTSENSNDSCGSQSQKKETKNSDIKEQSTLAALEDLCYFSPEIVEIIQQLSQSVSTSELQITDTMNIITPEEFSEQVRLLQISQGLDEVMKFYVTLMSIFSAEAGGLKSSTLKTKIVYLRPIASSIKPHNTLIALQDFFYLHRNSTIIPEGFKAYAAVLYAFYDQELISGEHIARFFEETPYKLLKNRHKDSVKAFELATEAAQPFLNWLNNSSDDEE
ncbi:eukaryotic translation initiation factor 5-like [Danaus plexippus]|uniref:eukaryotic translation initiation factor 5-like n=1 Tax=Danaus plexippus TaxID=13037 RepID=UPI002AB25F15|nr:eukaryotic translation initiation factor 5-like [Danaus plexippus]